MQSLTSKVMSCPKQEQDGQVLVEVKGKTNGLYCTYCDVNGCGGLS